MKSATLNPESKAAPLSTQPQVAAAECSLLARLRAGDDDAFAQLVSEQGPRLLAVARRFFPSEEDAQDVVQEAFLNAFKSLNHFAGEARLSTWLHRIVVNAALMRLRSRRRRPETPIDDLLPRFDDTGHRMDVMPAWENDDPADELQADEQRRAVRACIEQLPAHYREVIMLRDIEELDTLETARVLNITETTVKMRLHRARQALRTLIENTFAAR